MDNDDVIRALGALAHPVRLDVFRALVVAGPDGLTPGVFMERLGVPSATLSFHLKELADAGLVEQERAGRHIVYRATYGRMDGLIAYLTENCCQGSRIPAAVSSDACD